MKFYYFWSWKKGNESQEFFIFLELKEISMKAHCFEIVYKLRWILLSFYNFIKPFIIYLFKTESKYMEGKIRKKKENFFFFFFSFFPLPLDASLKETRKHFFLSLYFTFHELSAIRITKGVQCKKHEK